MFELGWQGGSVEKRMQAVAKMDQLDQANQSIFETLAEKDTESCVRNAALDKLNKPEVVYRISQTHFDATTRTHANMVFSALIGAHSTLALDEFRVLIAANPEMELAIAKHCPHAILRFEIVQQLSEPVLADLIADVDYNETRQVIAGRLKSEECLQRARNLLRGKDKRAEKIIKSKLDVLHAQQRQELENQTTAENITEKMEYLATHEWRAEFKGKYSVWSQRWESLDLMPNDDIQQRYSQASTMVAEQMAGELSKQSCYQTQKKLMQDLTAYCAEIANFSMRQLVEENSVLLTTLRESLAEWTRLSEVSSPELDVLERFSLAERALLAVSEFCGAKCWDSLNDSAKECPKDNSKHHIRLMESSVAGLFWPEQYPALLAKTEVITQLIELKTQNAESQKTAADNLKKLHKRINRLLGTTQRGDLSRAKRELVAATKKAALYTGNNKIKLDERLAGAAEEVRKMSDWKDFALEPKFVELCEAMEALNESNIHADKLSVKINDLQKRWKALGHANNADQHWQRFKTAADKAYQPCAVFFAQRHATQRQNSIKREPLVQQMRSLLENTDWDATPDYQQLEAQLRKINQAWQTIKDVERNAGQQQWRKLSKYKSAVYKKLDLVYDANIELKNQLIAQVLALLESDVNEDSITKLQLFQSRWKQVGITRRKQDQAAWKSFKTASDKVYQEIKSLRQTKRADQDAQIKEYRQIIREIQRLAKTATDLTEADNNYDRLRTDYQALPALAKDLPEKLVMGLKSELQRASDAHSDARDRINNASRATVLDTLAKKAVLCAELEQLEENAPAGAVDQLQKSLAAIKIGDKKLSNRIDQRIATALTFDRKQASQVRRRLCIDLEILLGQESPAEDAALRMKVQLERMQKHGIGQGLPQTGVTLSQLKLDWLCLPGAEPEVQKILDQRFKRLIKNR